MSAPTFCKHLRTKSMYIPALVREPAGEPEKQPSASPRHYWCNCTQSETGPDDKHVGPQGCASGRGCFEE